MKRNSVLLADDNEEIKNVVAGLLQKDYSVVGAVSNGESLIESSMRLEPDLVITDISMPLLTGIEAARHLTEFLPLTKIIFLTIHENPDIIDEATSIGSASYVFKSRLVVDLPNAIRAVLNDRQFISTH